MSDENKYPFTETCESTVEKSREGQFHGSRLRNGEQREITF